MAYNINNLPITISIGKYGEIDANRILFDVEDWFMRYPDGTYSLTYIRSGETRVFHELPSRVYRVGETLVWEPSAHVYEKSGDGTVVISCAENNVQKRATMFRSYVHEGHNLGVNPPPQIDLWIQDVAMYIGMAQDAISVAESNIIVSAEFIGNDIVFNKANGDTVVLNDAKIILQSIG